MHFFISSTSYQDHPDTLTSTSFIAFLKSTLHETSMVLAAIYQNFSQVSASSHRLIQMLYETLRMYSLMITLASLVGFMILSGYENKIYKIMNQYTYKYVITAALGRFTINNNSIRRALITY